MPFICKFVIKNPSTNKLTTIKIRIFLNLFVDNEMVSEIDFLNRKKGSCPNVNAKVRVSVWGHYQQYSSYIYLFQLYVGDLTVLSVEETGVSGKNPQTC